MLQCWLAKFVGGPCDFGPRAVPQACHLIPKQRLKRAGITDHKTLWDPRIVVPGCERMHHIFDSHGGYLAEDQYPESVREFAAEHGFVYSPRGWVEAYTSLAFVEAA